MTRATFTPHPIFPTITVNGRRVLCRRITEFRQTRPGHFEGAVGDQRFTIEGGRAAGGTSREWFLDWGDILPDYPCTSLIEALRAIESC